MVTVAFAVSESVVMVLEPDDLLIELEIDVEQDESL